MACGAMPCACITNNPDSETTLLCRMLPEVDRDVGSHLIPELRASSIVVEQEARQVGYEPHGVPDRNKGNNQSITATM